MSEGRTTSAAGSVPCKARAVPGPTDPPSAMSDAPSGASTERPRLAVRVTKDAGRQIRGGHPWVFDSSVVSVSPEGETGDLAVVFDEKRKFMAIGLFDADSPIRIRILHHGRPRTIDGEFWKERLAAAVARRGDLVGSDETTAYRVIHGENDGMGGLVLDRYGTAGVLKVYTAAWFAFLADLVPILRDVLALDTLLIRFSRGVAKGDTAGFVDGQALVGEVPGEPVTFRENDLRFSADLVHGHKTGHFLDQRDNRLWARSLSRGARVLDVFACTGGFSVNAAAGGASLVHSVDISPHAIDAAKANMALNSALPEVAAARHTVSVGDAFPLLEDLVAEGRHFDLVIVDPPSFASSKGQIGGALHSYSRLAELAAQLTVSGGHVMMCSCSARVSSSEFFAAVHRGVERAGRALVEESHSAHAVDHPIGFAEGGYLKALCGRVTVRSG